MKTPLLRFALSPASESCGAWLGIGRPGLLASTSIRRRFKSIL